MNLRFLKIMSLYGWFIFLPLFCMENVNYLQEIPQDILLSIISFLKFTDLNTIAHTNKYLNSFMKTKGFNFFIEHNKDSGNILYKAAQHGNCKRIEAMFNYTLPDKTQPSKIQTNSLGLKKYNWQENHHTYALFFAIHYKHYAAALFLLKQNIDLYTSGPDLLYEAIHYVQADKANHCNDTDYVQNLLNDYPQKLPINSIVKKLIKKGAQINTEHIGMALKISSDNFEVRKIKEKIGSEKFKQLSNGFGLISKLSFYKE